MTTNNKDIRWEQRFVNYKKALNRLQKFIDKGELSELEEQGLIKAFEYTYELARNTLKDCFKLFKDIFDSVFGFLGKAFEVLCCVTVNNDITH